MNRIQNEELYNKVIESQSTVERKGKTMPYTSLNGHMTSFLSKEGKVGLRLSPQDLNEVMDKYDAPLMVQHERTMKEFVDVPQSLLEDTPILQRYCEKSNRYVTSLKPKPSKKNKG